MWSQKIALKPSASYVSLEHRSRDCSRGLTGKPTSEERRDQTQQIIENRNSLGDNPRKQPHNRSDRNPGAGCDPVALVHAITVAEKTDVDVLAGDVAVYDASNDNLYALVVCLQYGVVILTVGKAIP